MRIQSTPPPKYLTDRTTALAAELDQLNQRARHVQAEQIRLRSNTKTGGLDDVARKADAELVAADVRAGGDGHDVGTPNADALAEQRNRVEATRQALAEGIAATTAELAAALLADADQIAGQADTAIDAAADRCRIAADELAEAFTGLKEAQGARLFIQRMTELDPGTSTNIAFAIPAATPLRSGLTKIDLAAALAAVSDALDERHGRRRTTTKLSDTVFAER